LGAEGVLINRRIFDQAQPRWTTSPYGPIIHLMVKWLPLLLLATAGLFIWFVYAFASDNNTAWTTSEPVQILTGTATVLGAASSVAIAGVGAARLLRRRRPGR
jgi:hypothetical protein